MIQDYIQSDPRWGNHPYDGENMTTSGCGPTAVADIVNVLPPTVADYITSIGGASGCGYGTYWSAIAPAAEHYGYSACQMNTNDLYGTYGSSTEQQWLAMMKTGKYYGILLMGKGYFCNVGHFIAISEVDKNNRAYAYDVAWNARSGWHDWSVYQGDVKVFYLVKKKDADPTPVKNTKYRFKTKTLWIGATGIDVFRLQVCLKARGFYTGLLDRSFGPDTRIALIAAQKRAGILADGVCGEQSWYMLLGLPKDSEGYWVAEPVFIGMVDNPSVLLWEQFCKAGGYYKGKLDWDFGTQLEAATKKVQKAMKHEVTGKVTAEDFKHAFG